MLDQIINKLRKELSQDKWDTYNEDAKISKLNEVTDQLKVIFNIEGPIRLSFLENERGASYVERSGVHFIEIGKLDLDSSKESVDNLAHELFHAMEFERIDEFKKIPPNEVIFKRIVQAESPFIKEWIKNKKAGYIEPTRPWWQFWISPENQYFKYRNQPLERDAWKKGEEMAKMLTNPISMKNSKPSFFDSIMDASQISLSEDDIKILAEIQEEIKNDHEH